LLKLQDWENNAITSKIGRQVRQARRWSWRERFISSPKLFNK